MNKRPSDPGDKPDFKVPNLERGLQILEYLVEINTSVALNSLSKDLDIPANSAGRIMSALEFYGYVQRDPATKKYALTHKMLAMTYNGASTRSLLEDSLDVMRDLRDVVEETVVISILEKNEGLVLEQIPGVHLFRFVVEPGTRQEPHSSASTKAILAFMPEGKRRAVLAKMDYPKHTAATITSPKEFLKELEEVRHKGYALDRAEAIDGVHCVAAPVLNHHGEAEAAVTITGPSNRMPLKSLDETGEQVKGFVERISERRGYLK